MNQEDRNRFSHFEELLQLHGERLAKIEEQNRNQYKMLKDIYKQLFGNGQEGLIRTVTRHKAYFAILGTAITLLAGAVLKILL